MSDILRYTSRERGNHLIIAICFILAAFSAPSQSDTCTSVAEALE